MTFARTLPASLPPRFAGAPRALGRAPRGSFELVIAEGLGLRLRGLAGLDPAELVPLLFLRCRSLHTFWMRASIDVVWLELDSEQGVVLALERGLAPRRIARAPRGFGPAARRTAALELAAGFAAESGLATGARLELAAPPPSAARR